MGNVLVCPYEASIVMGARGVGRNKADVGSQKHTRTHRGTELTFVSRIIYSSAASYSDRRLCAHVLLNTIFLSHRNAFRRSDAAHFHAQSNLISNESCIFRYANNLRYTFKHLQKVEFADGTLYKARNTDLT